MVFHISVSRLRGDLWRSLATLLAMIFTVGSVTSLAGTVTTSRAGVNQTVQQNFRNAYDIVVRPCGSTSSIEKAKGLLRSNYMSGAYGGISREQLAKIKAMPDVEIAAPIAVVGVVWQTVITPIDVSGMIPPGQERALFRVTTESVSRGGNVRIPGQQVHLYVTTQPLTQSLQETTSGGDTVKPPRYPAPVSSPSLEQRATRLTRYSMSTAPGSVGGTQNVLGGQTLVLLETSYPMMLAGIDPEAEAQLLGVDKSIVEGTYFAPGATYDRGEIRVDSPDFRIPSLPVLMTTMQPTDFRLDVRIDRLSAAAAEEYVRLPDNADPIGFVAGSTSEATVQQSMTGQQIYEMYRGRHPAGKPAVPFYQLTNGPQVDTEGLISVVNRPGQVRMEGVDVLSAMPSASGLDARGDSGLGGSYVASTVLGTGFRDVSTAKTRQFNLTVNGYFDPAKLQDFSPLSALPLETYQVADLRPADDASKAAVGGDRYLPDLNPLGYAQLPPAALVPLDSLALFDEFAQAPQLARDPISAIRIRVAGITTYDDATRARLQLLAEKIHAETGLEVDITVGTSPTDQAIALPADPKGMPAVTLREQWAKKGVAVGIMTAVDVKTLALSVLIAVTGAVTVGVVQTSVIAARRRELGVLRCIGWRSGMLLRQAATELMILAGAATIIGGGLAHVLAPWSDSRLTWTTGLGVPVACAAVMVLVGMIATAWALRTSSPADATRLEAPISRLRLPFPVRGAAGLGLNRLVAHPLRALVGVLAVAVGVTSLAVVAAIGASFRDGVVGTVMGNAVAVKVRHADMLAAVLLVALAAMTIATLMLLNGLEDAGILGTLQAVGWTRLRVGAVLAVQAAVLATLGAALGFAGAGLLASRLLGHAPTNLPLIATATGVGAVVLSLVASLVPIIRTQDRPPSELL